MAEERKLSEEERKAKEYVDFYYFWLFHYCGRNYSAELRKRIPPFSGDDSLGEHEQRRAIAQEIYWGHPLSSMYPQFLYDEDFTDTDDLFDGHTVPESLPSTLLQHLYDGCPISRHVERNKSYGMEILGTSGAHISTDGHLRGSIIARIDLRSPNSVILYELSKLRSATFRVFPEYFDAPQMHGLQGDYLHESQIIKQTTDAAFAVKDDAARAIGLWLWDAIDGQYAIFDSFAEAWKVICGEAVENILVGDACFTDSESESESEAATGAYETLLGSGEGDVTGHNIFFTAKRIGARGTWEIPTREVFSKLGYSASDPSVFRRLYRNTKRCIEACEVLSLKD